MNMDPSKFDTSRLIAGVESTGRYSVDDILQEFSDPDQTIGGAEHTPDPVEQETPAQAPQTEAEQEAPVQEEPVESQSPSELADAIAQAVASSVGQPQEEENFVPVAPATEEARMPIPEEEQEEMPAAEPVPEQPAPQPERSIPNVKTVANPVLRKAAREKKSPRITLPKGNEPPVSSGFTAALGDAVGALREVQRGDLPPVRTSLKAAEKSSAILVRISGMLSPVRYIILLLMIFALAGRRFSWMTLGFLGGSVGVSISIVCTLVAMAMAWQCLLKAVRDVLHLRLTYEPLLLFVTLMSLADTAVHKDPKTLLPLLVMAWCLAGTAELMKSRSNLRALRGVISGHSRKAVRVTENRWEHTDCIGKASASTAGFVRRMEEMDTFHVGWSAYSLLLVALSLIISAYLSAKTKGNYFSILVTLLTVAMPVSLCACCARPYELLTRIMNGAGAPAGWAGLRGISGKKAMLVYDEDLFPQGTIGHKGVRVYGNQTPRLLTSYAASLVLRANNGLGDVFTGLLREMDGRIYDVSYFQVMDAGLAGRINGVVVAVGTYHFMQLLGAMPPADAPKNGIYIAINGELAGVFAIRYKVRSGAAGGFLRLSRDRRLTTLMATRNFCVNPSFVRRWFKVPVAAVTCPKLETRLELSQPGILARGITCGFVTRDGIAPYSRLVAGGRRVYRMGLILTVLSIVLSLLMLIRTAMLISAGVGVWNGARLLLMQILLLLGLELWARFAVR